MGNVICVVEKKHRLFTPQINHISLRMPPSPLMTQHAHLGPNVLCNESTVHSNCHEEFCDCTYTLQVKLGSLVELVLIDEGEYFFFFVPNFSCLTGAEWKSY